MGICACIGPQGGDPACPCRMKTGTYCQTWTRFPDLEGPFTPNAKVLSEDPTCPDRFMWQGVCKYQINVIPLKSKA